MKFNYCNFAVISIIVSFAFFPLKAQVITHSWADIGNHDFYEDEDVEYRQSQKKIKAIPRNKYISKKKYNYNQKRKKSQKYYKKKSRHKKRPHKTKSRKNYIIYHKVKKGETLYKISKKYNININLIAKKNRLTSKSRIRSGIILKIPKNKFYPKKEKKFTLINIKKKKNRRFPKKTKVVRNVKKPKFLWPIKKIFKCKRDGINGVRSIGIIITGKRGSKVYTSAPGVVKKIGKMRGFGSYIIVLHKNRFITVYSNLGKISVSKGDSLRVKQIIGRIDKKLHFQIDYSGKPINPLKYLPRRS